jgi:hypothetical protein
VLRWQAETLPNSVKPATGARYMVSLNQPGPFLEHLEINQITKRTVASMISRRTAQSVTNVTIRRDLTVPSRLLAAYIA